MEEPKPPQIDDVLYRVPSRLRELRIRRRMTLTELASAVGSSPSTLSRLESGSRRPSLDMLLHLARVYGLTLDDLVAAPATGDPRIHLRPKVRFGWTWVPLSERPGGIHAFKLIIPGGSGSPAGDSSTGEPQQRSHEGYEWLYVLNGRLRILLGEHDLLLTPGEVAEFDTRTPHAFTNPTPDAVELLILLGPQGQRAHVRARPNRRRA